MSIFATYVPVVSVAIAVGSALFARRSSRFALLANAPSVYIKSSIEPGSDEDRLSVSIANGGPTEARDLYIEFYDTLSARELATRFPRRLPVSTWRESRVNGKSEISLSNSMEIYRGLGLPLAFYAKGFEFAWVFFRDRLGNRYAELMKCFDEGVAATQDTEGRQRTLGPLKISPAAQLFWRSKTKVRWFNRRWLKRPFQHLDPRTRSVIAIVARPEPSEYSSPLAEIFPGLDFEAVLFPVLTFTSEEEGASMICATDTPTDVEKITSAWRLLKAFSEPVGDVECRLYRSPENVEAFKLPWTIATAKAQFYEISAALTADQGPKRPNKLSNHFRRRKPERVIKLVGDTDHSLRPGSSQVSYHRIPQGTAPQD